MIFRRITYIRFLAAVLLLGWVGMSFACNNDQGLTDRHERTLAEEEG